MDKQSFLQDLQDRLGELLRNSPAQDVERNLKAMLAQTFQRMELVTRDELDTMAGVLSTLRVRIEALESTVAQLEAERAGTPAGTAPPAGTHDTRPPGA